MYDVNAGTLNREQTVVPGYLPLKLNVAQSMMSGTDLGKYVLTLCQAVADYSNEYVSNDPHGTAVIRLIRVLCIG